MKVLVTTEERFTRTPDGQVWSVGSGAYSFWKRYLDVFEEVNVLARVAEASSVPGAAKRADGENVGFCGLPHYVGAFGYLRQFVSVKAAIRRSMEPNEAIVLRVASPIASLVERELPPGRPFAVELVGDPHDVFAPGSIRHVLRPVLRSLLTKQVRRQCQAAAAVAYVTSESLQQRYPASANSLHTTYSSIELCDEAFVKSPRGFTAAPERIRIISVGTLEVPYKGMDVLIDAIAICRKTMNKIVELVIVGDGRCRAELERRAQACGIDRRETFIGRIPSGEAVRNELDRADLFVLASKTEGLPRAMIEAMARALPCIGSDVGGIPELLAPRELVPRNDPHALSQKIADLANSPERMTVLSATNLVKARSYHDSTLRIRRRALLSHLRQATQDWLDQRASTTSELVKLPGTNPAQVARYE